jgi:hypothetical protein
VLLGTMMAQIFVKGFYDNIGYLIRLLLAGCSRRQMW